MTKTIPIMLKKVIAAIDLLIALLDTSAHCYSSSYSSHSYRVSLKNVKQRFLSNFYSRSRILRFSRVLESEFQARFI